MNFIYKDPLNPKYISPMVKHPDKIMVWGCFSYNGLGKLIILPPNQTVNSASYLRLLKTHLKKCYRMCGVNRRSGWLMHDGARPHTARIVSNWLGDNNFDHFKPGLVIPLILTQ